MKWEGREIVTCCNWCHCPHKLYRSQFLSLSLTQSSSLSLFLTQSSSLSLSLSDRVTHHYFHFFPPIFISLQLLKRNESWSPLFSSLHLHFSSFLLSLTSLCYFFLSLSSHSFRVLSLTFLMKKSHLWTLSHFRNNCSFHYILLLFSFSSLSLSLSLLLCFSLSSINISSHSLTRFFVIHSLINIQTLQASEEEEKITNYSSRIMTLITESHIWKHNEQWQQLKKACLSSSLPESTYEK